MCAWERFVSFSRQKKSSSHITSHYITLHYVLFSRQKKSSSHITLHYITLHYVSFSRQKKSSSQCSARGVPVIDGGGAAGGAAIPLSPGAGRLS